MLKATKSKALSKREIQFNKGVSRLRYKVERTFGSTNRWLGAGIARYVELNKMHTQHLMQAIAYNLYCSPGRIMLYCKIKG
jgi:IS5 family transposase